MLSRTRSRPILGLATLALLSAACSDRTASVVDPSLRAAAQSPSANLVSTPTTWDFASLAGKAGPLGNPASFTIAGAGTIVATAQLALNPAAQVYSKGFGLPDGDPERGLGLCRDWNSGQCIGPQDSEIGDDYSTVTADGISPYLVLDFTGLTPGSTVQSVTLGSLQLNEGYLIESSVDGVTYTLMAQHETGPTDPVVQTVSVPTGAKFLRFDPDPKGGAGNNYVLMSVTTVQTTSPCPPVSITSNFNGTPVAGGDFIWFNGVFKPKNVPAGGGTMNFSNGAVTFTSAGVNYTVPVPPSIVTFSPSATQATSSFDGTTWHITVPANYTGNIFFGGAAFQIPAGGLPGGTNPVVWSESMTTNMSGMSLNWQWAAAAYKTFSSDLSTLGVKPVDANNLSAYLNSDHAGTPENFRAYVTGGTRGGGGSNFTGSYSGTGSNIPCQSQ